MRSRSESATKKSKNQEPGYCKNVEVCRQHNYDRHFEKVDSSRPRQATRHQKYSPTRVCLMRLESKVKFPSIVPTLLCGTFGNGGTKTFMLFFYGRGKMGGNNNRLLRDESIESCLTEQSCSVDLP